MIGACVFVCVYDGEKKEVDIQHGENSFFYSIWGGEDQLWISEDKDINRDGAACQRSLKLFLAKMLNIKWFKIIETSE